MGPGAPVARPVLILGGARCAGREGRGVLDWLKADHDLGRGHGMALVHVIEKGPQIDAKHVGSSDTHREESDTLWLDGIATKPATDR